MLPQAAVFRLKLASIVTVTPAGLPVQHATGSSVGAAACLAASRRARGIAKVVVWRHRGVAGFVFGTRAYWPLKILNLEPLTFYRDTQLSM